MDDLPHLEILYLTAAYLVIILCLADLWRISVLGRLKVAVADGSKPLEAEHPTDVTLELKDDLLDLVAHVSLLNTLQLRHRLFDKFENGLILEHGLVLSCQQGPESFFCLFDVNFIVIIFFVITVSVTRYILVISFTDGQIACLSSDLQVRHRRRLSLPFPFLAIFFIK